MSDAKKYGRGQVIEIINSVITKMDHTKDDKRDVLLHISELAQIIDSLKKEIALTNPEHVKNSHIPDATDELDAVVASTANATNAIMGICEEMETLADDLSGEQKDTLTKKVTEIYEACSFQDITGQRIKKVVNTLRVIEEKIDRIIATLDDKVGLVISNTKYEKVVSIDDEKSLMNGPQLEGQAISQSEIDKLLAEFDGK